MITLHSPEDARELLALACEIRSQDALMTWQEAIHEACAELPAVLDLVAVDVRYAPARVVLFDDAGYPRRSPAASGWHYEHLETDWISAPGVDYETAVAQGCHEVAGN